MLPLSSITRKPMPTGTGGFVGPSRSTNTLETDTGEGMLTQQRQATTTTQMPTGGFVGPNATGKTALGVSRPDISVAAPTGQANNMEAGGLVGQARQPATTNTGTGGFVGPGPQAAGMEFREGEPYPKRPLTGLMSPDEQNPGDYTDHKVDVGNPEDWVTENSTVSGQMEGLLGKNSKYLNLARTKAMQTANSRGMLNSSMAAGAGEAAAIEAALPIAQQDAATYKEMQARGQTTEYQGQLNSQQAWYQMDQTKLQGLISADLNEQQSQIQAFQKELDFGYKTKLDQMSIDASMKQVLMQNAAESGRTLQTNMEYILKDPDLNATAKQNAIQLLINQYHNSLDVAAALGGLNLDWG